MSNEPRIAKLQALLQRIQRHAAEPRVEPPPAVAAPAHPPPPPPPPPKSVRAKEPPPLPEKPHVQTKAWESPMDSFLAGMGAPEPHAIDVSPAPAAPMEREPIAVSASAGKPITPPKEPTIQTREPSTPIAPPEPAEVEAISGEYAVYHEGEEAPLELEELGPADIVEEDEAVVEIHVEAPIEERAPEEEIAERMESGPAPAPVEEPPASGREIVAAPTESSRMKVATPLTQEKIELERAEPPPPPSALESQASSRTTQRLGRVSSPVSIPPEPAIEPPPKTPIPPMAEPKSTAIEARPSIPLTANEPPPKTPIPVAPAPEPLPEPRVLRANIVTPKHVAAFVDASRKTLPTTFAALLDDALSL